MQLGQMNDQDEQTTRANKQLGQTPGQIIEGNRFKDK